MMRPSRDGKATKCDRSDDMFAIPDELTMVALGLAAVDAWWLIRLRRRLEGTVLLHTWYWGVWLLVVATLAVFAGRWWELSPSVRDSLKWLLLSAGFCPFVARLGAKRPQHRAWHWIVLSFWVIAGLPAWQSIAAGRAFRVGLLWDGLLVLLLLMQTADCLATRVWAAPWFLSAGQLLLHPDPRWWKALPDSPALVVMAFLLGSIGLLALLRGWQPLPRTALGWTRVWRDFRDRMGVLWSLRLLQRFEQDSRQDETRVLLRWDGFVEADASGFRFLEALPEETERLMRNLLRRFVDHSWIEAELAATSATAGKVTS